MTTDFDCTTDVSTTTTGVVDCTDIINDMVADLLVDDISLLNIVCTHIDCEFKGVPQPISNFSVHSNGKTYECKSCVCRRNRERRLKRKSLSMLKNEDFQQFKTTVAYTYISISHKSKTSINSILSDFNITKQELINIVKAEQLFEFKVCKECERLKSFNEYFSNGKLLKRRCKKCMTTERSNSEQVKQYHRELINRFVNYDKYSPRLFADKCRRSKIDPSKLQVACAYCGRFYSPKYSQVHNRLTSMSGYASAVDTRFYCSDNCKYECPLYNKSAEQLMKVDMGIDIPLNREVQAEVRQLVLERDNYTCQKCGKYQDDLTVGLHAHHIEGVRWNPIESADIDQVITVCVNCHKIIHKIPGCTTYDMRCSVIDMDEDTLNKIKKNKEIKKQDIDKDVIN